MRIPTHKITAHEANHMAMVLQDYRAQHNMTYAAMDEQCLLGRGSIGDLAGNRHKNATIRHCQRVALGLQMTLDQLLGPEDAADPVPPLAEPVLTVGHSDDRLSMPPLELPVPSEMSTMVVPQTGGVEFVLVGGYTKEHFSTALRQALTDLERQGVTPTIHFSSFGAPAYEGKEWYACLLTWTRLL